MLIRILVVEDEPLFFWEIEQMLEELGGYDLLGGFADFDGALHYLVNTEEVIDVILIDIHLKGRLTGIDLAKKISDKKIPVVFITQDENDEIYEEAKLVDNYTFLVKPFHKFTLNSAITLLLSNHLNKIPSQSKQILYVKVGNKREVIEPQHIAWIESSRNYCTIHTTDNSFILRKSLKSLLGILPTDLFIFIHKSFVVQLALIETVDIKKKIVIVRNASLPLGRSYIKSVRQHLVHLG
jgi:DNA-binding LytR/AlgR family response regulator